MFKKISFGFYIGWMSLFVLAPSFIILFYSLTDPEGNFSLANFSKLFSYPLYWVILQRSFTLAIATSFVCLLFAYPMAWAMATAPKKWINISTLLLITPMWINLLIRTYAWMKLLGQNGALNGFLTFWGWESHNFLYNEWTILFGMVYNFFPFMVLPIYNSLRKIYRFQRDLIEAAQDLGADSVKTFWKIIFPLSLPGVSSGIALVIIPSVTVFVIADLLGGAKNMLIGNLIEQQFFFARNWHLGSAASILLLILVAAVPLLRFLLNINKIKFIPLRRNAIK